MSSSVKGAGTQVTVGNDRTPPVFGGGDVGTVLTTNEDYIGVAGVISNLAIHTNDSTGTGRNANSVKNGAAGNMSLTIGDGLTGWFEDVTNSDTVAAGDLYRVFCDGATATWTVHQGRVKFTPTSVHASLVSGIFITTPSATRYYQLTGRTNDSGTETDVQTKMNLNGTARRMSVVFSTNTSGTSTTVRTRKNTANGAQSVSIAAGVTGRFTDVTNTDSYAATDLLNYQVTGQNATVTPALFTMTLERSTSAYEFGSMAGGTRTASATVHYNDFGNNFRNTNTVEAESKFRFGLSIKTTNFRVRMLTNSYTGSCTARVRKNGADGNQVLTIASGTTGWFEDTTNNDTFGPTDDLAWSIANGTSGSAQPRGVFVNCDEILALGRSQGYIYG